jgi:hypothetical protein
VKPPSLHLLITPTAAFGAPRGSTNIDKLTISVSRINVLSVVGRIRLKKSVHFHSGIELSLLISASSVSSGFSQADSAHSLFFLKDLLPLGDARPILCFLDFDTFELSKGRRPFGGRSISEIFSFALMEMFVFNSLEIVQRVLARTAARIKSACFARGASARTSS